MAQPGPSDQGEKGNARSSRSTLPTYLSTADDDFVIGDLDDDEDEKGSLGYEKAGGEVQVATPPAIDSSPPPYSDLGDVPQCKEGMAKREQCAIHYVKPDDTLSGLALHYRVDGNVLARMNKLPSSTLSTTPALLHALPFLLLPPDATSSSSKPIHPPEEERRRLILRRFQVHTRCSDWAMANSYVSQVFDKRDKEAEFVRQNCEARGEASAGVAVREGGELEEAMESWKRDQEWEEREKGKGKMGSKMRSTGLVESQVKGWSWRP